MNWDALLVDFIRKATPPQFKQYCIPGESVISNTLLIFNHYRYMIEIIFTCR